MKQKLIVLLVLAAIATGLYAQNNYDRVTIGVKGGINISKIKSSNTAEQSLTGLLGGVFVYIPLNNHFSFQSELLYSQMGGSYSTNGTAWATLPPSSIDFYLKYIDVPLILKYRVSKSAFSLVAGPQVSYLLSAKVNVSNESYDDKSNLNGFDFRGIFGAEYALLKGFSVSARYQLGLYNINKGSNSEAKNNAFSLTLGYTLDSK